MLGEELRYNAGMRGTILNTATVAAGASLGMLVGAHVPPLYQEVAMSGLGLVVFGIGVKMFFEAKDTVAVLAAIALGGVLGTFIGIAPGLEHLSEWARQSLGGGSHFNDRWVAKNWGLTWEERDAADGS